MTSRPISVSDADPVSPQLREMWKAERLAPLWESPNGDIGPRRALETARVWRWTDTRPVLLETAKIVTPSIVERRVLQFSDAQSGAAPDVTTGAMNGTLQAMMPGEVARPHRHTMNALRFVLEGDGAQTIVAGKRCDMFPGDLVTTPAMTWHEHVNATDVPALWLDILDAGMMRRLGVAAFYPGPVTGEPPAAIADAALARSGVVPTHVTAQALADSPMFRYAWSDVRSALDAAPTRADGAREVRYVNPLTGGPCISLIDCTVIEVPAGGRTAFRRTSASCIVSVVDGEGVSRIDDAAIEWREKDTFTVPQHAWFSHEASRGPVRLFIASNRPVYERLGLLAEETRA